VRLSLDVTTMHDELTMSNLEDGLPEEAERHDFDALFRAEQDGLYRTILAFTGGRADVAEEATAEAFARAYAHRSEIRDPLAWVYRVAFRIATDEVRRDRRRGADTEMAIPEADPMMTDLIVALRRISAKQRAAIVLRHVADLEMEEVARRMGIATPTVRVHLHRGRSKLRKLLGSEEDVDD
jgi:RNA polymerase sigma-70 factor (ECF subfamily)